MFNHNQIDVNDPNNPPEILELIIEHVDSERRARRLERIRRLGTLVYRTFVMAVVLTTALTFLN